MTECRTTCDVGKHWALPPFPLLSIAFSEPLRKEGREGRQAWQTEFEVLVLVALRKGIRTVWLGATQGKGDGRGTGRKEWREQFPSRSVYGVVTRALEC